jgi:hypothetical protein
MQGYDPKSTWDADADDTSDEIYASAETPQSSSTDQVLASEKRRQDIYLAVDKSKRFG